MGTDNNIFTSFFRKRKIRKMIKSFSINEEKPYLDLLYSIFIDLHKYSFKYDPFIIKEVYSIGFMSIYENDKFEYFKNAIESEQVLDLQSDSWIDDFTNYIYYYAISYLNKDIITILAYKYINIYPRSYGFFWSKNITREYFDNEIKIKKNLLYLNNSSASTS